MNLTQILLDWIDTICDYYTFDDVPVSETSYYRIKSKNDKVKDVHNKWFKSKTSNFIFQRDLLKKLTTINGYYTYNDLDISTEAYRCAVRDNKDISAIHDKWFKPINNNEYKELMLLDHIKNLNDYYCISSIPFCSSFYRRCKRKNNKIKDIDKKYCLREDVYNRVLVIRDFYGKVNSIFFKKDIPMSIKSYYSTINRVDELLEFHKKHYRINHRVDVESFLYKVNRIKEEFCSIQIPFSYKSYCNIIATDEKLMKIHKKYSIDTRTYKKKYKDKVESKTIKVIMFMNEVNDYFNNEQIESVVGTGSKTFANQNPMILKKYNKFFLNESKYKFVMFLRNCCKTFDDNDILQMMAKQTYFNYLSEFPELECIHNKWYVDMKSESSIDSKVIVDDNDDIIDLWNSNDFDNIDLDVTYEDDSLKLIMDYIDNFSDDYFTIDDIPVPKNVWRYRRKVNKKVNEFHQAFFKSKLTIKKPTQINE